MGGRGGRSHSASGGGGVSYEMFPNSAFSALQKNLAFDPRSRIEADAKHRGYLDSIWDTLSDYEKYSIWQYTEGSGGFNRPLSGYLQNWGNYVGTNNVPLSSENKAGWLPGEFEKIVGSKSVHYDLATENLTGAIQKSRLQQNTYLARGSDVAGLTGLFRNSGHFDDIVVAARSASEADLKRLLVGSSAYNPAFTSTGVHSSSAFDGDVRYKIYAPKGTRGIYAEPQSNYGATSPDRLYKKGMHYSRVGSEAEIILQRGTEFRVTNVSVSYGRIKIEMEIVAQPVFQNKRSRTK